MSKAALRKLKKQQGVDGKMTQRSVKPMTNVSLNFSQLHQQPQLTERYPELFHDSRELTDEPINISMGKAVNRSLNRSINKSLNKSVNKSIRSRRDGGDITDT
mmetsp:Transcript_31517/g.48193  ORF Transcript_31517/g.48193 Transcript_31517/m.48193 type:complete len:103 (-) Transcript_31517:338-646(-)